jgi:hypothetical protein
MKRFMVATAAAGLVFGSVWALAATLNVAPGTAATGEGVVSSCGDVTNSSYVLVGRIVTGSGASPADGSVESGQPTDITKVYGVNIEVPGGCIVAEGENGSPDSGTQLNVQVRNGADLGVAGSCEVQSDGGLGLKELDPTDNTPGCTAWFSAATDVAPITGLVVTET